jgi:hypothetical protein
LPGLLLLEAHSQAKGFLAQPAVRREEIDARRAAERTTSGPDSIPPDSAARIELLSTLGPERGEDVENALKFLKRSGKPGSLGPSGALRSAGGSGKRRFWNGGEGVRREAAPIRRHQAHVAAPGRDGGIQQVALRMGDPASALLMTVVNRIDHASSLCPDVKPPSACPRELGSGHRQGIGVRQSRRYSNSILLERSPLDDRESPLPPVWSVASLRCT